MIVLWFLLFIFVAVSVTCLGKMLSNWIHTEFFIRAIARRNKFNW